MNIGIISSKEYLPLARIMLTSLLSTTESMVNLYLFHIDLKETDIEFLNIEANRMIIYPIMIDPSCFDGIKVESHFGIFSYFRLLAPYVLPCEVERIMWLDTDLIIQKDLLEYYNSDFAGNALIASPSVMNQLGKGLCTELKNKYNVGEKSIYFNAGVLIMNLQLIRDCVSLDEILQIAHNDKEKLKYIDQDILNILFWNKCKITSQYLYNFSPKDGYYDKNITKETISKAYIIHYCGQKKPTDYTYPDVGFDEYWRYAKVYSMNEYRRVKFLHTLYDLARKIKHALFRSNRR